VTEQRLEALASVWMWFADREFGTYAPLYASIARTVATDEELLRLVLSSPPVAHQPNVLLSAVHYLLLDGADHPLTTLYADPDGREAGSEFRDFCLANRDAILDLMQTRRIQTNEVGRAPVLAVGLAAAADRIGQPFGLIDAGSSAGLNLVFDRYLLDFGPYGRLGPADSPVRISCEVRGGGLCVPRSLPQIGVRLGLDRSPPDLSDPDDVRWLMACVWPGTGRLARTEAAIDLARRQLPLVLAGDMVEDLPATLAKVSPGPVAVVTSWSFSYLTPQQQAAFREVLSTESRRRVVAWVSCDGKGVVAEVDSPGGAVEETQVAPPSVLGLVVYEKGKSESTHLALVHAHGAWIRPSPWTSRAG
jgi:hypothetical protein